MNSENKIYQIPEFTGENIPLKEATRIMGKDYQWVCLGMIEGLLPIETAFKMPNSSVYSFYISPKLFWEYTRYISWKRSRELN